MTHTSAPQPPDVSTSHNAHQMEPPPSYNDVMENLLNEYNANEDNASFSESNESIIGSLENKSKAAKGAVG